MTTYQIIDSISLKRLNAAEYTMFLTRIFGVTDAAKDKLFGTTELKTAAEPKLDAMTDNLNRTKASVETAEMQTLDTERDSCISYMMATIRAAKNSPIEEQRQAYTALDTVALRPYKGIAKLPNFEETITIKGLIMDMRKPENALHITALNLDPIIKNLEMANIRYEQLMAARNDTRIAESIDATKVIRAELDTIYSNFTMRITATNIITPSNESTSAVTTINKIIAETKALLNQRTAKRKTTSETPDKPEQPEQNTTE